MTLFRALVVFAAAPSAALAAQVAPAPVSPSPSVAPRPQTAVVARPIPVRVQTPPTPVQPPVPATLPAPPAIDVDGNLQRLRMNLDELRLQVPLPVRIDDLQLRQELFTQEQALATTEQALSRARAEADQAMMQAEISRLTFTTGNQGGSYNAGLNLLNQRRFDQAIQQFDRVIASKDARADGATYHKAFAQFRSGRTPEALETLASLRRDFPQSRYLADAKVLEADIRRLAGQPVSPSAADDDEIKLLAISGIQRSEQAIPLLEGVLTANNALAVKKRALFVLATNDDARASAILMRYAKGAGNPDLQLEAIRLLASRRDGRTTSQDLRDIYESTQDASVRLAIIDAYRSASDTRALVSVIANNNAALTLRGRALDGLAGLATPAELWSLYEKEPDATLRAQMASTFGSMRAVTELSRIAQTDANESVRRRAVSVLGGLRGEQGAPARQALLDLYGAQTDPSVRQAIIGALGTVEGAEALVSLAKKETSLDLKRAIVQRLSNLAPRSKVAADYLMEVIK